MVKCSVGGVFIFVCVCDKVVSFVFVVEMMMMLVGVWFRLMGFLLLLMLLGVVVNRCIVLF